MNCEKQNRDKTEQRNIKTVKKQNMQKTEHDKQ